VNSLDYVWSYGNANNREQGASSVPCSLIFVDNRGAILYYNSDVADKDSRKGVLLANQIYLCTEEAQFEKRVFV
jgi:hypothetical protein